MMVIFVKNIFYKRKLLTGRPSQATAKVEPIGSAVSSGFTELDPFIYIVLAKLF